MTVVAASHQLAIAEIEQRPGSDLVADLVPICDRRIENIGSTRHLQAAKFRKSVANNQHDFDPERMVCKHGGKQIYDVRLGVPQRREVGIFERGVGDFVPIQTAGDRNFTLKDEDLGQATSQQPCACYRRAPTGHAKAAHPSRTPTIPS